MLYTTDHWRPTRVELAGDSAETSTGCTRVVTDAGDAYCKPLGNRQGPCVLASEWACVRLAQWFDLPTFPAAIVNLQEDATFPLPEHKGHKYHAQAGPCFLTKAIAGDKWDRTTQTLSLLTNVQDVSKLVVFDTLVANRDRHHPDPKVRHPNPDNVYLAFGEGQGQRTLIAMDHTHCFGLKGGDELNAACLGKYERDEVLYGLFPEFVPVLHAHALSEACGKLATLSEDAVRPIIDEIPREFAVSYAEKAAWAAAIVARAHWLSPVLTARILGNAKSSA